MGALDELLRDGESVELETGRHPGQVLKRGLALLLGLAAVTVMGSLVVEDTAAELLRWASVALIAVLTVRVLLALGRWNAEQVLITDHRLLTSTGFLRRKVTSLPLHRVHDVALERTFSGRMFGFGDVLIDTDDRRLRLARVPHPKRFYRTLLDVMEGDQGFTVELGSAGADDDTGPLPRLPI